MISRTEENLARVDALLAMSRTKRFQNQPDDETFQKLTISLGWSSMAEMMDAMLFVARVLEDEKAAVAP